MTLAGFTGRNNWPGRFRQHGRSDLCRVPGENRFYLVRTCPSLSYTGKEHAYDLAFGWA